MELLLFTLLRAASYVAIALGFALVFGAGRILNLSHGAFFLVGAYLAHLAARQPFVPGGPLVAYAVAVAATGLLGWAVFHLLLRRSAHSPERTMVLCLGLNFLVSESLRAWFGTQGVLVTPALAGGVSIAGVALARQQLLVLPAALALLGGTAFVLYRTRMGRALRAVAQDREAAEIVGVPATAVLGWTFAAAAGMAALAACLVAPLTVIGPSGWISPLLKSFAVVVLGGTRHLRGTAAAALVLATCEVATSLWIAEGAAEYVSLVIVVAVLIARPKGILGAA